MHCHSTIEVKQYHGVEFSSLWLLPDNFNLSLTRTVGYCLEFLRMMPTFRLIGKYSRVYVNNYFMLMDAIGNLQPYLQANSVVIPEFESFLNKPYGE